MPAATTRCSAEALVTARTLPCQGLEDICGGVRVDKALCLPVGLQVLAQGRAGFHNHMGARLVGGCKALWLRVHGAYHRLLPSLLKPLALPLVLEHLVEFCPTTCFDVLVRRLSGFTCQQRSTQRTAKKAPRWRPLMQWMRTLSPFHTVFLTAGQTSVHCSERS